MDEEKPTPAPDLSPAPAPDPAPDKLIFVMLVVLIICGGNALGILTAALIWKLSGSIPAAILALAGITLVAFVCGMALVVLRSRRKKQ